MKANLGCIIIICLFSHFNFVTSDTCFGPICISSGYNKLIKPPLTINETNILIEIDFVFLQILNVDENEDTVTIKCTLEITWREPRIIISNNVSKEEAESMKTNYFTLPKEFKGSIIYFIPKITQTRRVTYENLLYLLIKLSKSSTEHFLQ